MLGQTSQEARGNRLRLTRNPEAGKSEAESPTATLWMEIADVTSQQARYEFIAQHAELLHIDVVSELAARVPQLVKSDQKRALSVAEAAVIIARRLKNPRALAQSLRAKGNALHGLGQNR